MDNSSSNEFSPFDNGRKEFYLIQFWLFVVLVIPSIVFTLFALYYLLFDRTLRQSLNNHSIILILIINLFCECTDIPFYIYYFHCFESLTDLSSFRLIWGYLDWTLFLIFFMLYSWITIERHLLIFHNHLFDSRKKRICFHYLPPIILCLYSSLFYGVLFFVPQCDNSLQDLAQPVFYPCVFANNTLAMYDIIADSIFPTLTIVISSVTLLFRVLWQKHHLHQRIDWRRQRKLTIQVLSISFLYLVLSFPYLFVTFLHVCGMPSNIGSDFLTYTVYGVYYTMFLFPMVCIGSLPELRKKIHNILHLRLQRNAVVPANFGSLARTNNRIVPQRQI